jgi:glycogen synthase
VKPACTGFKDKTAWHRTQGNAMDRDFGWDRSAKRYLAVYHDLLHAGGRSTGEPRTVGGRVG